MTLFAKIHRLIEPGSNLYVFEYPILYGLVLWFGTVTGDWGDALREIAWWNATCQLCLFVAVVQLPALLTGHMSYVDIGWPCGLTVLAYNTLYHTHGGGNETRTQLVGALLMLHGSRMFAGALHMLYPYKWKEEFFSRYQYAKTRWIQQTGSDSLWWLKQQHDTLMQANANSVPLAAPILLATTNPRPTLHPLEVVGAVGWIISWCLENWADVSKKVFEIKTKSQGIYMTTVIGHDAPYNSGAYSIWTWSRHPNYFFEWTCWISFMIMAVPSAMDLMMDSDQPMSAKLGIWLILVYAPRLFYDCLIYWTGAAPAESRSIQRRPAYKEFQATTNVMFPFDVPFFQHHKTPGWPLVVEKTVSGGGAGATKAKIKMV